MYKFAFPSAKQSLKNVFLGKQNLDPEVKEELEIYRKELRETGDITGASLVALQDGSSAKEKNCRTFVLLYRTDAHKKIIVIEHVELKGNPDYASLREMLNRLSTCETSEMLHPRIVPQSDNPISIIRLVELIYEGIIDPLALGERLGHKGKKPEFRIRHGNYKIAAAEALGLLQREKRGRKKPPVLTEKGLRIALNKGDNDTQCRLLAESMLRCSIIASVIGPALDQNKELRQEMFIETIRLHAKPGSKASTIRRRAKCLEAWSVWLVREMGYCVPTDGSQLELFTVVHREGKIRRAIPSIT
jgi:hypothetical protein